MRARHLVGWMLGGALAVTGCNANTGKQGAAEHGQKGALDENAYRGGVKAATVGGGSGDQGGWSNQGGGSGSLGGGSDQGGSSSSQGVGSAGQGANLGGGDEARGRGLEAQGGSAVKSGGSGDQGGGSKAQSGGSKAKSGGSKAKSGGSKTQSGGSGGQGGTSKPQGGDSGSSGGQRAQGAARVQAGEPASSEQRATPQADFSANQLRDQPEGSAKPGAGQTGAFGGSASAGSGTALDTCERIADAASRKDASKLGELTAGDALEHERVRKAFFETWSTATCSDLNAQGDHATVKVVTGERGVPSSVQTVPFIKTSKGWVLDSEAYVARYPKEMVSPQHHEPGEPARR